MEKADSCRTLMQGRDGSQMVHEAYVPEGDNLLSQLAELMDEALRQQTE
jgi:hypothetical protein